MPSAPRPAPGQLGAGLTASGDSSLLAPAPPRAPATTHLPALPIEPDWKGQPRLWGHSFHPMATYLASFPAPMAHAFIARYSRPGDVVLDPFSGRGTVPLQACAERRIGVGNDLNPFAHLLTAAKVDPPSPREAGTRLAHLRIDWSRDASAWLERGEAAAQDGSVPPEVAHAFHPSTLAQLLFIRAALRLDDRVDRFLAAAVTGILHGRSAGYLSGVMPNSFSMAPDYVLAFSTRTGFQPARRDLWTGLAAKLVRLYRDGIPATRGLALTGDARDAGERTRAALRTAGLPELVRLVMMSPPYLRVISYGASNWLRMWFLGQEPGAVDRCLERPAGVPAYVGFLRAVLAGLRPVLAPDAVVVLVVGDVASDRGRPIGDGDRLAEAVWAGAGAPEGYRLAGVTIDEVAPARKLTRLWGSTAGRATVTDRLLVIAPTEVGRRRARAAAGTPVDWRWPPGEPGSVAILPPYAADVPPGRPRGHGPARAHEEPGPRAHDVAAPELHPPAAAAPVRP